jgi:5'-nucleotidase
MHHHLGYSQDVDFSAAAHFTRLFAGLLMDRKLPPDVHVLKVDVPADATAETPWPAARVALQPYYSPTAPDRLDWGQPGTPGYKQAEPPENQAADGDVSVLRSKRSVAVVPISLDLTSRVDLGSFEALLRKQAESKGPWRPPDGDGGLRSGE